MTSTRKPEYFTPDELRRLLEVAYAHDRVHHMALLVGAQHGLRASEIVSLTGAMISNGHIAITRKKNSYKTLHAVHADRSPLFDESPIVMMATENQGRLFDFSRQYMDVFIKKYCAMAGIHSSKAHAHSLKHACCMAIWRKTRNLNAVQDWVGHRSFSSSLFYLKHDGLEEAKAAVASGLFY